MGKILESVLPGLLLYVLNILGTNISKPFIRAKRSNHG